MKWGKEGNAPGQFKSPWGVACDPLGYVYIVDSGNHRVQKFDSSGTYLTSWGNRGLTEGQLNFPSGIAVDKEGYVYVIDSGNHRLTKFAPTEEELNRGKQEKRVASDLTAPINLAVKPGDTENILSWLEVPNAVSYNLYFSTEPNLSADTSTKIEGVTTPYIHSGLTNNTAYFYAMTSVTEEGAESRISEEKTAIPVLIDISAPQNPDIVLNHGAYMTNSPDMVATISAKDIDSGVAAYFISENPMTPSGTMPGWVEVEPEQKFGATIPFTTSPTDGTKTVYVWFKDANNNVSVPASTNILLNTSGIYLCRKVGKTRPRSLPPPRRRIY